MFLEYTVYNLYDIDDNVMITVFQWLLNVFQYQLS